MSLKANGMWGILCRKEVEVSMQPSIFGETHVTHVLKLPVHIRLLLLNGINYSGSNPYLGKAEDVIFLASEQRGLRSNTSTALFSILILSKSFHFCVPVCVCVC